MVSTTTLVLTFLVVFVAVPRAAHCDSVWIGTSPFCSVIPGDCRARGMVAERKDNCGDGACCWTGYKYLCVTDTELDNRPKVWIGDAPACGANWWDCNYFSLEYIDQSVTGASGKRCVVGKKVLCASRKALRPLERTPSNQLQVVSYNVFERPYFISHDGQRERTCRIPRNLLAVIPTLDVIVFNELFLGGCHPGDLSMATLLRQYNFTYVTDILGDSESVEGVQVVSGGVMVASRWPLVASAELVFYNKAIFETADQFAQKGAVYVKIRKPGDGSSQVYHVFGTHLQSSDGPSVDAVRRRQAEELASFISSQNIPEDEPVIIAGDFNADVISNKDHVDDVLDILQAELPPFSDGALQASFSPDNNTLVATEYASRGNVLLDYGLYLTNHSPPLNATTEVIRLRHKNEFAVCMSAPAQPFYAFPNTVRCSDTDYIKDLSDHYPVLSTFIFP